MGAYINPVNQTKDKLMHPDVSDLHYYLKDK